jgi:hypothetical protein
MADVTVGYDMASKRGATTKNPPKTGQKLTSALQRMMTSGSHTLSTYFFVFRAFRSKSDRRSIFFGEGARMHEILSEDPTVECTKF